MTKLLDQAFASARRLAPEQQDELAEIMLFYADAPQIELTPSEDADLAAAEQEVARGELATDEEMRAIWAKRRT